MFCYEKVTEKEKLKVPNFQLKSDGNSEIREHIKHRKKILCEGTRNLIFAVLADKKQQNVVQ